MRWDEEREGEREGEGNGGDVTNFFWSSCDVPPPAPPPLCCWSCARRPFRICEMESVSSGGKREGEEGEGQGKSEQELMQGMN